MRIENNLKYFTTDELSDLMKIKLSTVRGWIRRKMIKAVKIGGKWYIPETEVDKLYKTNE